MTAIAVPPGPVAAEDTSPATYRQRAWRDAHPTLPEVLNLDAVRLARPRVLAACAHLLRPVRAARVVSFGEDCWRAAQGGDVLLLDRAAVPSDRSEFRAVLERLATSSITSVMIASGGGGHAVRALAGAGVRAVGRAAGRTQRTGGVARPGG